MATDSLVSNVRGGERQDGDWAKTLPIKLEAEDYTVDETGDSLAIIDSIPPDLFYGSETSFYSRDKLLAIIEKLRVPFYFNPCDMVIVEYSQEIYTPPDFNIYDVSLYSDFVHAAYGLGGQPNGNEDPFNKRFTNAEARNDCVDIFYTLYETFGSAFSVPCKCRKGTIMNKGVYYEEVKSFNRYNRM
jgi:hypothetical protein